MLKPSRLRVKESTFDKSSCIKQTIYQNSHSSYMLFSYLSWTAASDGWSLTTLFSTKMRGGGEQPQEHQHPCPILLTFCPPLCKNQKKPEVDKKSQACEETLTLTKGFVFSSCKCSKQSVSCLLTLTQSEHFIWSGCFQICSGNNNTLLHAYEVIHLIKKDMFRSRVKYF